MRERMREIGRGRDRNGRGWKRQRKIKRERETVRELKGVR